MQDARPYLKLIAKFRKAALDGMKRDDLASWKFNSEQAASWRRYVKNQRAYELYQRKLQKKVGGPPPIVVKTSADVDKGAFGKLA